MIEYNSSDKLTKHFTHGEVAKSYTATRHNIDNTPSSQILLNAQLLARNVLEPIRTHYGIPFSPQSWYRSEALEKNISWDSFVDWCGRHGYHQPDDEAWADYFSRKSHPNGEAADIEIPSISNDDLYDWILNNLEFDQLIREFPKPGDPMSGWVHVSWSATGNRNQSFTIGG